MANEGQEDTAGQIGEELFTWHPAEEFTGHDPLPPGIAAVVEERLDERIEAVADGAKLNDGTPAHNMILDLYLLWMLRKKQKPSFAADGAFARLVAFSHEIATGEENRSFAK